VTFPACLCLTLAAALAVLVGLLCLALACARDEAARERTRAVRAERKNSHLMDVLSSVTAEQAALRAKLAAAEAMSARRRPATVGSVLDEAGQWPRRVVDVN
jgi:hypothetical protein